MILEEIKNHFSNSNKTIWLYEERAWKEIVFLYNINKSDVNFLNLNMLNNPLIWNPKKNFRNNLKNKWKQKK